MRLINIDLDDHELFMSSVDSSLYNFFLDHKDTFRQMWEEQGKRFWVHFLISYREYIYNRGPGDTFIEQAELNYSMHDLSLVGDGVFLNIHKHFIEGKINNACDFMEDIVVVAQNRNLLLNLGKKSIVSNPLYIKDVRDSFRKLYLHYQLFHLSQKDTFVFHIGFATPTYMKFCGAIHVMLKRWLSSKICPEKSFPPYWPTPSHWMSADFHYSPFHFYLLHAWNTNVDEICGLRGLHKTLSDKMNEIKAKQKAEGSTNTKGCDMAKYGIDVNLFANEMKERKLFLLAKKQFEEEVICKGTCHTSKKKSKKKNAIRNAIEKAGKDQSEIKPKKETSNIGVDSAAKATEKNTKLTKNDVKQTKRDGKPNEESKYQMNDIESQLIEINENIHIVKKTVKEEGGLSVSFTLLEKTGEMLTRETQLEDELGAQQKITLHECSHCGEKEVTPKTFKKCSRCKVENIDKPRYYCCRECQIDDWEECHRKEHSLFQKK